MKVCPSCRSELVSRSGINVCPRNEIGECCFDAYQDMNVRLQAEPTPSYRALERQPELTALSK